MAKCLVYFCDGDGDHLVDIEVGEDVEDLPDLLFAMAERLGVDLGLVETPAQLGGLQRACNACTAKGRCRQWVAAATAAALDEHRQFCPNADVLDRLFVVAAVAAGLGRDVLASVH
jgi:hypothetical protein